MIYNLTHRGATIATFDTNTMEPDEVAALKSLRCGRYFDVVQANPDRLPEIPGYSMMEDIQRSRKANPDRKWYRTGYQPAELRF